MAAKTITFCVAILLTLQSIAQQNFQFKPDQPKAGDVITFTYEPVGAITGTTKPVEAAVYFSGREQAAEDLILTRNGKQYSGTIKTDTSQNFVYLGFSADGKWDNNAGEGYYIQLHDGSNIKKGSHASLSQFYQYSGIRVGLERDNVKAVTAFEKELESYPDARKENLTQYAYLLTAAKKSEAVPLILKEIETVLQDSLASEEDYATVARLYQVAKLPQQSKLINQIRKEKYPAGKWVIEETLDRFYSEQEPEKSEKLLTEILDKTKSDSAWKYIESFTDNLKAQVLYRYANKKDWAGLKRTMASMSIKDKDQMASTYNNIAWGMQEKEGVDLKTAEELSRFATQYAKAEMKKPSSKKPGYVTGKQWTQQRTDMYTMYADTYAMVLYRMGDYKNAYKYAKEAAITMGGGKEVNKNNTYALIAEKVLPTKQYKSELEAFAKQGMVSKDISAGLKRAYAKETGSESGFDAYMAALQKESMRKMLEELKKSMLNKAAPSFTLLDLDGNTINSADLKGKTVVVDFWATWCGPCKASFPGMQKMVTKFKDNPDVKFVFVDTWERGDDKKKNAADFITSNKYTFQVLLDDENKVVEQFGVEGIPTKFVIDKDGMIRFQSVGFDGSDEKLVQELTAMIEMASAPAAQKTF
jgi:peroxiredoxin